MWEVLLLTYTGVVLAIYAPIETWASFPHWTSLDYLVDVIGMTLMAIGLVRARRHAPGNYAPILAAAFGWTGANFWRAMSLRLGSGYDARQWPEGKLVGDLLGGSPSAGITAIGLALVLLCAVGMLLTIMASAEDAQPIDDLDIRIRRYQR